jgi:hypothetical protein
MFHLGVVVMCSSSTGAFLRGSSLPFTDVAFLLACRYVTAFSSPLVSLVSGRNFVSCGAFRGRCYATAR